MLALRPTFSRFALPFSAVDAPLRATVGAPIMSFSRPRHWSGGTDRFSKRVFSRVWAQRLGSKDIDLTIEDTFEKLLNVAEPEEPDRLRGLDEDIDVAVRTG